MLVTLKRPGCKRASLSERVDHFSMRTPTLSVNTGMHTHIHKHTYAYTCNHAHTGNVCIFPLFPSSPLLQWLTCSFIQLSTNSGAMVTAAEMFFPQETDNIEITTPLTTQPPPPSSYHPSSTALSLRSAVSGAVCHVKGAGNVTNSLAGVCALPAPAPDSAQGLLWCFSWKNPWDVAESLVGQGLGAVAAYWHWISNCRSRISYCG